MSFARISAMADPGKIYPIDFNLLRKETQMQGELLDQERVERKAEVDELRLELASLRKLLEQHIPDFSSQYDRLYREHRESYDPEQRKRVSEG